MTYEGELVVDSVVHAVNNDFSNARNETARNAMQDFYGMQENVPEQYRADREDYFSDRTPEQIADVTFLESDVDFGVYHTVPLFDYFEDGWIALEKGLALREMHPERFKVYGAVDPLADDALDDLERQVTDLDVDGIKIYPAYYRDSETLNLWLNEGNRGRPILERAVELGVDKVAVHKSIPIGPTPSRLFRTEDIEEVALEFPDVDFEVVHAGFAFLEEQVSLLARFDNVYANLETTLTTMVIQPRQFAKTLGEMLLWADEDRIMFASGTIIGHPQMLIEHFWDFQIPADLREEFGYPELTDEVKRKILGLNALAYHGIDPEDLRETVESDDIARKRAAMDERPRPWSNIGAEG